MRTKDRIERATGVIWGLYDLTTTWGGRGEFAQPAFYVMFNRKRDAQAGLRALVRVELGFGRRGFYLDWGQR